MQENNPLLQSWDTPYGLPPFDRIQPEHWAPALQTAMDRHQVEIAAIAANQAAPDFDNTLAALDRSGRLLSRVAGAFFNLCASETSPALQAVELEMTPRFAAHQSRLYLDGALFARVDAIHQARHGSGLTPDQVRLAERVHLDFVINGARLKPAQKQRYQEIVEKLSELCTRFAQNVLGDESGWQLLLSEPTDLDGLPQSLRDAARQAAIERGLPDSWVITLSRSLLEPFLTHSRRRDLREIAWRAFSSRGELAAERDNRPLAKEILELRLEQARLHDCPSYADFALRDRMAKTPSAVISLLERVWAPGCAQAGRELKLLSELALSQGQDPQIEAWDWLFWSEQVRLRDYQLDDAELKPYFQLDRMIEAMFDCARRLFGIRFVEVQGVPLYHADVRIWEVRDAASDRLTGIFLGDNFARSSKRSGAWMSNYREQSRNSPDGQAVLPIVVNNNNFARGAAGAATLLSFDDVTTLFHEFGHGLHGLLSDCTWERLAGTNVLRDFVELPSKLFEHWALEPSVLARHARHEQTGAAIPQGLLDRIKAGRNFNQGYLTVQYLGPALIDMALHQKTDMAGLDIAAFEAEECRALDLPPAVGLRHRLPHFLHLFSGAEYAAGYYVYLWAEVLEADAYEAFEQAGDPFDAALAGRLKRFIYSSGNSQDPAEAYRAFRGRDPEVGALLAQRGFQ